MYSLPLDYTTAARHCVLRGTTHLTGYARISEPVQRAILEILCQKTLEGNTGPVLLHSWTTRQQQGLFAQEEGMSQARW